MAHCGICGHQRVREINVDLLMHRRRKEICKRYKVGREMLAGHARHHIPWRHPWSKKPATCAEKLAELHYELARLQMLAECDPRFSATESLRVMRARRVLLELEMRSQGLLDSTHNKLIAKSRVPMGDYEVIFEDGKPRTVPVVNGNESP